MSRPDPNPKADAADEVDLRERDVLDLRNDPEPGRPGLCPECGAQGYLDNISVRTQTQAEHCDACGCVWRRSIDPETASVEILQSARG